MINKVHIIGKCFAATTAKILGGGGCTCPLGSDGSASDAFQQG